MPATQHADVHFSDIVWPLGQLLTLWLISHVDVHSRPVYYYSMASHSSADSG